MARAKEPTSWSGFYAGVNGGYQWGVGDAGLSLEPSLAAWTAGDPAFSQFHGKYADSPNGWLGGAQLGFNWQAGTIVVGLEADFNWLDADETTGRSALLPVLGFNNSGIVRQDLDWLATVRARLGLIMSHHRHLLVYLTGGVGFGELTTLHYSINTDATPDAGFRGSSSDVEVGGVIGAGLEWMLHKSWTFKTEYLYYDLGDRTDAGENFNSASPPGFRADGHYDTAGHIVRVGLNYRLGGP